MKSLDRLRNRFHWIDRIGEQVTDPVKFRRINGWMVVFWTLMLPFSIITGLWTLVAYVSLLSIYANWATHLGVWAASRAEVKADVGIKTTEADIEARHATVVADEVD